MTNASSIRQALVLGGAPRAVRADGGLEIVAEMEGFGAKVAKRGDLVLVNYVGSVKNDDGRPGIGILSLQYIHTQSPKPPYAFTPCHPTYHMHSHQVTQRVQHAPPGGICAG